MFNLASFLEKFKNLKDPKEDKVTISTIIKSVAGVTVLEKEISIQRNTIFIQGNSLSKNRIFITKEEIVKKINEALPDLHITEII